MMKERWYYETIEPVSTPWDVNRGQFISLIRPVI